MLFSEFQQGTGCKDNEYNHKVYEDLEVMYMNSDISKQEIYEYGKKLVDNSKSEEQLELEARIKAEIAGLKEQLRTFQADAKRYMEYHRAEIGDRYWLDQARWQKELARTTKRQIAGLKWVLE